MTLNGYDILDKISERCDPDEILDRLGINSEELVQILATQIFSKLGSFDDIVDEEDEL